MLIDNKYTLILRSATDYRAGLILNVTAIGLEGEFIDSVCYIDRTDHSLLVLMSTMCAADRIEAVLMIDPDMEMTRVLSFVPTFQSEFGYPLVQPETFEHVVASEMVEAEQTTDECGDIDCVECPNIEHCFSDEFDEILLTEEVVNPEGFRLAPAREQRDWEADYEERIGG